MSSLIKAITHPALGVKEAGSLRASLAESADVTVFVNGTALRLPDGARDALLDALTRFARGESVTISTAESLLNTSQAAQLAGVSASYLRQLTDSGAIPVEYRGSHRRIRPADVQAWLDSRAGAAHKSAAGGDQGIPPALSGPGSRA